MKRQGPSATALHLRPSCQSLLRSLAAAPNRTKLKPKQERKQSSRGHVKCMVCCVLVHGPDGARVHTGYAYRAQSWRGLAGKRSSRSASTDSRAARAGGPCSTIILAPPARVLTARGRCVYCGRMLTERAPTVDLIAVITGKWRRKLRQRDEAGL